ncbi:hypothetical protein ACLH0O_15060 [Aeromonas media]
MKADVITSFDQPPYYSVFPEPTPQQAKTNLHISPQRVISQLNVLTTHVNLLIPRTDQTQD